MDRRTRYLRKRFCVSQTLPEEAYHGSSPKDVSVGITKNTLFSDSARTRGPNPNKSLSIIPTTARESDTIYIYIYASFEKMWTTDIETKTKIQIDLLIRTWGVPIFGTRLHYRLDFEKDS